MKLLLILLHVNSWAAIPVFKNPYSELASGNYQRSVLEKKTSDVRLQKWIETEVDGQKGWLPASQVWQAFDLSRQVLVKKGTPLREKPVVASTPKKVSDKEDLVPVNRSRDGWIEITWQKRPMWIEADLAELQPSAVDDAVVRQNTTLAREIPIESAPVNAAASLVAGERVRVLATLEGWTQVETPTKKTGYVKSSGLWRGAAHQVVVRPAGLELRATPSFQARPIKRVAAGSQLHVASAKLVRWGFAKVGSTEEIWWAMDEAPGSLPRLKKTSQLFRDPIFDMASSPSIPNLTFLSAHGVYRSLDGENWEKLEDFSEQDQPIAVSSNGSIFVGDTRSRDNGQKFEGYIQWDQLMAAIRRKESVSLENLKLVKIDFPEGSDQIVQLTLLSKNRELTVTGQNPNSYRWRLESSRKL